MEWISLPENISLLNCNTNNHHDRDPYFINEEDELIIDNHWWNVEVPEKTKELLRERNVEFTLGNVQIPHENQFDERLIDVYKAFQEGFEYQEWLEYSRTGAKIFKISAEEKAKPDWDSISDRLDIFLKNNFNENENKFFVRTGSTSGKNTVPICSCSTSKEILGHLLKNPEIQLREWNRFDKNTYIICIPWNDNINQRNEFRLFVINNKIVALSPQKYWECHNYSEEELEAVEYAVLNSEIISPYKTYIIDAWIDFINKKLHVIEFNCFGDHSGAGSSLFNWHKDRDILYGKAQPEFRFLSMINLYHV